MLIHDLLSYLYKCCMLESNGSQPVLNSSVNGSLTSLSNGSKNEVEAKPAGKHTGLDVDLAKNSTVDELVSSGNSTNTQRKLLEETQSKQVHEGVSKSNVGGSDGSGTDRAATVENAGSLEEEADSSFDLFRDGDELADEYNYDYDDYVDENMWGDEEWSEGTHEKMEDYVNIDSHILCTPVIVNILNFVTLLVVVYWL